MIETDGRIKSPAAGPDDIRDPAIGIEDDAGGDAGSRAAKLWQIRREIASLREDSTAIARSLRVEMAGRMRRKPWAAMAAALCAGICLGRGTHR